MDKKLSDIVCDKKVLFITTKNIDYIRNTQEIRILKENAREVRLLYSDEKSYPKRILSIYGKLTKKKTDWADILFVGFAPQLVIPFLKFKGIRKPVIMDFFISVYDTLACDRKVLRRKGLLANACHKLDSFTLKKADHIIADTNAHAAYFIEEFGADPDKTETLYLEADETIYHSVEEVEDTDLFIVLYFGSILPLQGVDIILSAIRLLKDEKEILFDMIGPIPDKYHKPEQDNVQYTEWLPQEELAKRIAAASLCLAGHFNVEIEKAHRTIPGKAYIYEKIGKPMVLGDSPANHEYFCSDERHKFVKMGNPKALADMILECFNIWKDKKEKKVSSEAGGGIGIK